MTKTTKKIMGQEIEAEWAEKTERGLVKVRSSDALVMLEREDNEFRRVLSNVAGLLKHNPSPAVVTKIFDMIKRDWMKVLEDNLATLRELLLNYTAENGEVLDNSRSQQTEFKIAGRTLRVERRVQLHSLKAKENDATIRALLRSKKIDPRKVFVEQVTEVLDEGKLDVLVAEGKLTRAEVESCRQQKAVQLIVEEK